MKEAYLKLEKHNSKDKYKRMLIEKKSKLELTERLVVTLAISIFEPTRFFNLADTLNLIYLLIYLNPNQFSNLNRFKKLNSEIQGAGKL